MPRRPSQSRNESLYILGALWIFSTASPKALWPTLRIGKPEDRPQNQTTFAILFAINRPAKTSL
jgi:hypothetical protein